MPKKPTYEELKQKVKELEKKNVQGTREKKAIRESEDKYRRLFENVSDAVMIFDAETWIFEDANQATLDLYGYSKEEFLALTVEGISAEKEKTRLSVQKIINGKPGSKRVFLRYFKRKDGTTFPGEISAGTFVSGERKKIIGAVRDITERKRVEEALRESQQRLDLALDAGGCGMWDFNPTTFGDTHYNNRWFTMLGYAPDELPRTAETWLNLLHPDDCEPVQGKLQYHIEGKGDYIAEFRLKAKGGDYRWIHSVGKVVASDPNGTPERMIGIHVDITDHREAEEALRESEEKYRSLYDAMKEGVAIHEVVYDASGEAKDYIILDVNPSYEKILGLKKEKAVGCKASELYGTGQPPYIEIYAKVAASGQATSFETYFPPMDKHFSISVFSPRRGQFATVFTDITDRKRVEESLQRAHEKLELRVEERTAELARTNELLRKQIAERKRAEGKLQESEWMARALLNTPTDIAGVLDRRGIVLDANQTMCRRFHKSVDDLMGVCIWDLLPPNLAKVRKSYVDKVFQSGKPVRIEDERDGYWFDNVVHPVFDANGKVSKVALLARDITEMKRKEKELAEKEAELRTKAKNLEEVNTALRVLLKRREEDKGELEEKVLSNVKELVVPYIERLKKTTLDTNQMSCVDILESNLKEIVSPFSCKLSSKYLGLTPTEIRVANLIKNDKTTKEIAEIMNVSERTVDTHRDHIRKKIGIKRKKVNLRTYLLSLQ